MRVIPVLDLMGGLVVRGVGGRRDEYRPIESQLCADARPGTVAAAFVAEGFRLAYVADLDAIERKGKSDYSALIEPGLDLWVDAGVSTVEQACELASLEWQGRRLAGIVAGLESVGGPEALGAMCRAIGPERLIFSLDLKLGEPLFRSAEWQGLSAEQIAQIALRVGVRRMIVLDLARVGMGAGVGTEPLCRSLRSASAELEIIGGGGVRGPDDLETLERAGCDGALVASALHDGRLSPRACAARR